MNVLSTLGAQSTSEDGNLFLPAASETYTHDLDGNLTRDSRWNLTWDGENRLITAETTTAAVNAGTPRQRLTFGYDPRGRRVSKRLEQWVSGAWTFVEEQRFLYDGWNLVTELGFIPGTPGSPQWAPPTWFVFQIYGSNPVGGGTPDVTWLKRSYTWGLDLSGSLQGAGGVGGLLAILDTASTNSTHFTVYDGNGNVTEGRYVWKPRK